MVNIAINKKFLLFHIFLSFLCHFYKFYNTLSKSKFLDFTKYKSF